MSAGGRFHAQREALSILDEQALNVTAHSIFPGMPDADIKRERGGGNHNYKSRHGFEKDAVSQIAASNLYPAPRTVLRYPPRRNIQFAVFLAMVI
jgi:hypothetical protein